MSEQHTAAGNNIFQTQFKQSRRDVQKAAVLFISGQSNAHAHGQAMKACDRIETPLKNVFSLDRNPNQSFDITDVVWSGFTTKGKNLGETQDDTYSFAYFFAKLWQNAVDLGACLPDLYIVQISIGSQGIVNGMWNPDTEKIMQPGVLGTVNISLFPWALQVNQLVLRHLSARGKNPFVIGWHWIGSEQDAWEGGFDRADFLQRYDYFFDSMLQSMGEPCSVYLYKLCFQKFCLEANISSRGIDVVNDALQRQCKRHDNMVFIKTDRCPYWDENAPHDGIFAADNAHYLPEVQQWFAKRFYTEIRKKFHQ